MYGVLRFRRTVGQVPWENPTSFLFQTVNFIFVTAILQAKKNIISAENIITILTAG
jgi:hypothetical protein